MLYESICKSVLLGCVLTLSQPTHKQTSANVPINFLLSFSHFCSIAICSVQLFGQISLWFKIWLSQVKPQSFILLFSFSLFFLSITYRSPMYICFRRATTRWMSQSVWQGQSPRSWLTTDLLVSLQCRMMGQTSPIQLDICAHCRWAHLNSTRCTLRQAVKRRQHTLSYQTVMILPTLTIINVLARIFTTNRINCLPTVYIPTRRAHHPNGWIWWKQTVTTTTTAPTIPTHRFPPHSLHSTRKMKYNRRKLHSKKDNLQKKTINHFVHYSVVNVVKQKVDSENTSLKCSKSTMTFSFQKKT